MRKRKLRFVIIVLLLVVGLPAAGYGIYALTIGRSPFEGEHMHDFGIVPVVGGKTTVVHEFELTNRTGKTLTVLKIVPSCGCAVADLSSWLIDPGQTVTLRIALSLTRSVLKREAVGIVMKGRGARLIEVRAQGRVDPPLRTPQVVLELQENERAAFSFNQEIWDDPAPPRPTLEAPPGVTLTTQGWSLLKEANAKTGEPAFWEGQAIAVLEPGAELAEDAAITIRIADGRSIAIPVRRDV